LAELFETQKAMVHQLRQEARLAEEKAARLAHALSVEMASRDEDKAIQSKREAKLERKLVRKKKRCGEWQDYAASLEQELDNLRKEVERKDTAAKADEGDDELEDVFSNLVVTPRQPRKQRKMEGKKEKAALQDMTNMKTADHVDYGPFSSAPPPTTPPCRTRKAKATQT
jgi:hypothetical protein